MSSDVLDRIETKLDKQSEHLASIDITLVKQNAALEEHIRRTGLLENALKEHFTVDQTNLTRLESRLAPILESRKFWARLKKYFLGLVAACTAVAELLHQLFFHHR